MSQIVINTDKITDKAIQKLVEGRVKAILRNDKFLNTYVNVQADSIIKGKLMNIDIHSLIINNVHKSLQSLNIRQQVSNEVTKNLAAILRPHTQPQYTSADLEKINRQNIGMLFADEIKRPARKKAATKKVKHK